MDSLSLYTIPLIYLLLIGSFNLSGQSEFYSIELGIRGELVNPYHAVPLNDGKALLSLYRRNQQSGNSKLGWIIIDEYGELVDSFYYKENLKVSDHGKTMILMGDTVLQLAGNTTDRKLLSVHGSSLSSKDSLFRWQYDFSDISGIHLVTGQCVHMNQLGNIVIMGTYTEDEPNNPRWLKNVYLVELTRNGELIRRKKVTEIREHSNSNYVRVTSRILETDDAYFVAVQRENHTSDYIIVKMDKLGELAWEVYGDLGFYGGGLYAMPDIFLSLDGTRLQLVHCMAEDWEDYPDHEADSLYNLYGDAEMVIYREYDLQSGERLSHSQKPVYQNGTIVATYGAAKSSVTGEIVFGGQWYAILDSNPINLYNGLVGKVSENGTFSDLKRVMEEFGDPRVRGQEFRGVIELSTGDFLFYGWLRNGGVDGGQGGWLMKLPLSICGEGIFCDGDTLSLNTFTTSISETRIGQYSALQLHPNPTSPGQSIHLAGFPNEGYTGAISLRLLDLQGRVVHETSLNGGHSDAIRWELPVSLRSGVYLIEMTTAGGAVAGGKIMVVGE